MAIIADDDKLQQDPNQQAQGQGAPGISGGGPTTVTNGQSSADVGSPVSTAGVGAGGTGGWTNIQAYIDANKGDTGSAQALDKTVSGEFGNEKNAYTQDSSKFLTDAQQKVDADKIDKNKADELIGQASGLYNYNTPAANKSGPLAYSAPNNGLVKATPGAGQTTPAPQHAPEASDPNLNYDDIVGKMKGALTNQYSGPREYNYAIGNKAAEYGADVNDDQGFDGLMKHIYQQSAPGGLNAGQTELQKQLDVNNVGLVNKRKELQGQYADLTAGRDKAVSDTTSGLSALEQQYRENQHGLQDYLGQRSNEYTTSMQQKEAAARDSFNQEMQGMSGIGSNARQHIYNYVFDNPNAGDATFRDADGEYNNRANHNLWGTNLSWDQLQKEQDLLGPNKASTEWIDRPGLAYSGQALNNFYDAENQKYGNVDEPERRSWNAIQDFLGSTDARKDQGFKVRG